MTPCEFCNSLYIRQLGSDPTLPGAIVAHLVG
jgi:hypothetical protein